MVDIRGGSAGLLPGQEDNGTAASQGKDLGTKGSDPAALAEMENEAAPAANDGSRLTYDKNGSKNEEKGPPQSRAMKRAIRLLGNKKVLGVGGGAGALGISMVVFFLGLQPLKINFFVSNLTSHFGSASSIAGHSMSANLLNTYYVKYVLPDLVKGFRPCYGTITPGCVEVKGKGPVAAYIKSLANKHFEGQMPWKFYRLNGQLYMHNVTGTDHIISVEDLAKAQRGEKTIVDLAEIGKNGRGERAALKAAVNKALEDSTLWERVYYRLVLGPFASAKYGAKRCIIACNIRDKYLDPPTQKVRFWKAKFIEKISTPLGDDIAGAFRKVIEGKNPEEEMQLNNAQTGSADPEKVTEIQADVQSRAIAEAVDETTKLTDTLEVVAGKEGFVNTALIRALSLLIGKEAAEKGVHALPIIGQVLLVAQILAIEKNAGPTLRMAAYAANATAAVKLYTSYASADAEMKSGHVDLVMLGSMADALSRNISGSPDDRSDATTTPLYGVLFGGGSNTTNYVCNDGKPVSKTPPSQGGPLVCPEEQLSNGNMAANLMSYIFSLNPNLSKAVDLVNKVNELIGWLAGGAIDLACKGVNAVPPGGTCDNLLHWLGGYVSQFGYWLITLLVPTPFSDNMSGGRTFDMMAAGADVMHNKTCEVKLGCAPITNQQAAAMQSQVLAEEKADFDQQPLTTKLFGTDTPYSLISQVAVVAPSSSSVLFANVSNFMNNPFGTIGSMFAGMFAGKSVFADPTNIPTDDPFGVIQYGYLPDQVPNDPEAYWDQNCQDKDFSKTWFEAMQQDEATGEAVPAKGPEPCLLIQAIAQSNSAFLDPSTAPAGSLNTDN